MLFWPNMMMNKQYMIQKSIVLFRWYIQSFLIIFCLLFVSKNTKAAFTQQAQQSEFSPYSISDTGHLHYNLQVNDSSFLAIELNLHHLFPYTTVESLRLKRYELTPTDLNIASYGSVPISVRYQLINGELKISDSTNWPGNLTLTSDLFTLSFIRKLTSLFATNDLNQLKQLTWQAIPKENILLFLSQLNDFSSVEEFSYNAIHNILASKNYAVAKFFYTSFLTGNKQFNDFELLKIAIEQADIDFIRNTSLNSLNILGVDEVKFDYYFTQCTLLGKAIQLKNKAIVSYLLDRGALTEKVYKDQSETLSALQLAQKLKAKKLFNLFK